MGAELSSFPVWVHSVTHSPSGPCWRHHQHLSSCSRCFHPQLLSLAVVLVLWCWCCGLLWWCFSAKRSPECSHSVTVSPRGGDPHVPTCGSDFLSWILSALKPHRGKHQQTVVLWWEPRLGWSPVPSGTPGQAAGSCHVAGWSLLLPSDGLHKRPSGTGVCPFPGSLTSWGMWEPTNDSTFSPALFLHSPEPSSFPAP